MEILKLDLNRSEPEVPSETEVRFQIALLASIATTVLSLAARFALDVPLLPELLAHAIFAILPISFIALVVGYFGLFAKHLAFLACVLVYLASLVSLTYFFLRSYKDDISSNKTIRLFA